MSSEQPAKDQPTEAPAKDEDVDETIRRRNMFRDSIDQIDLSVNAGAENGLFEEVKKRREKIPEDREKIPEDIFERILNKLSEANENLSKEKYPYARTEKNISEAIELYSKALYTPTPSWRFVNMYGAYMWFYLIGILAAVFFVFFYSRELLTTSLGIDQAALNAAAWGVIAAVLRAMWFLRGTVDERRYRKSWNLYFISIPFIGGILGSIVYLIILGGLIALSTTTTTASINPLAIIPFAALAGYNWEWAINIFNRIGELVESKPPPDRASKLTRSK
jgi:hypothetical protein